MATDPELLSKLFEAALKEADPVPAQGVPARPSLHPTPARGDNSMARVNRSSTPAGNLSVERPITDEAIGRQAGRM